MANLEENIKLLVKKLDCGKVKICATGKAEEYCRVTIRASYLVCSQSRSNWERGSQLLSSALNLHF